jgi:DNA-directed RNA polymerase specialized sigma24 family protein
VSIFPLTSVSAVAAASSEDPGERERALDAIARAYWKPVYKYLRLRWDLAREDAEDLTQEFFARAARESTFGRYDASVARFRTFLRACVDSTAKNARTSAARSKRGGGHVHLSFSSELTAMSEAELVGITAPPEHQMEEFFRREWMRSIFDLAVRETRNELLGSGKQAHWGVFERYDFAAHGPAGRPTYADLGVELGLPTTQVTNFLALARRTFRRILLDRLREQCATNAEYREEARDLLGTTLI